MLLSAVILSPLLWFLSWKEIFKRDLDPVAVRCFQQPGNVPARNGAAPCPALGHARIFEIHRAGQGGIAAKTGDDLFNLHTHDLRVTCITVNVECVSFFAAC